MAALFILPASASGATVAVVPGGDDVPTAIQYRAATGEANKLDVKVAADGRSAEVSDPGADSITPGVGCTAQGAKKATCAAPAGAPKITDVDAELLDGNDTFDLAGASGDADGGAGNDTLRGGELSDVLRGGTGTDDLRGDGGSDTLSDGDVTGQSVDRDAIDGGPANDFVDYTSRTATVTVDLGDAAGDGESGEDDRLSGIENVAGGLASDAIRGDANANVLQGGPGDDTVEGRDGSDYLGGSSGRDTLVGGPGTDDIEAGEDDDTIRPENPAGQFDRLITCGDGKDTIVGIAPRPSVAITCELGDFGFGFVAGLKPKKVTMATVTVKIPCPDAYKRDGACKGSIVVERSGAYARSDAERRAQRYGAKGFRITKSTKVSVRLNAAGRRQLRKSAFKLQFTINLKETATKTKRRFEWTSYLVRSFL